MRNLVLHFFLILAISTSAIAQEQNLIPPGIKGAIINGNSKQLADHFNKNIELLIKNTEDVYSKAQAELILKDFFTKNTPKDFIVELEGQSDGFNYAIGHLKTTGGGFRVYLAYQNINGKSVINRLNISEYN